MARKRRRTQRAKFHPLSRYNMIAIIVGAVEIVLFAASVSRYFIEQTEMMKAFASLGTICIFISFINLIISLRGFLAHEYNIIGRVFSVIISLSSLFLWLGMYVVGLTAVLK